MLFELWCRCFEPGLDSQGMTAVLGASWWQDGGGGAPELSLLSRWCRAAGISEELHVGSCPLVLLAHGAPVLIPSCPTPSSCVLGAASWCCFATLTSSAGGRGLGGGAGGLGAPRPETRLRGHPERRAGGGGSSTVSVGERLLKGKNCLKNGKKKGGERNLLGKEHECRASLEVWEIHSAELQTMLASSTLLGCVRGGFLVLFSFFFYFLIFLNSQTPFLSRGPG